MLLGKVMQALMTPIQSLETRGREKTGTKGGEEGKQPDFISQSVT